jgi:hypothetical protein
MVILIQRLVKGFRIGPRMTVDEVFRSSAYPRAPLLTPARPLGGGVSGGKGGREEGGASQNIHYRVWNGTTYTLRMYILMRSKIHASVPEGLFRISRILKNPHRKLRRASKVLGLVFARMCPRVKVIHSVGGTSTHSPIWNRQLQPLSWRLFRALLYDE